MKRTTTVLRRNHVWVGAGGLAVLFVCGAAAHGGKVGTPERYAFRAINDLPAWLYRPMWCFQQVGNLAVALVVGLVVAAVLRNWRLAVGVIAAAVLKLGLERAIKQVVERGRPSTVLSNVHLRGDVPTRGLSFVSGHAVITAAVAGLVSPVLPRRWRLVPWLLVVLNGVARIYVGAHNPLDIVGGIGAGLIIAAVLNAVLLPEHEPSRGPRSTPTESGRRLA